MEGEGRGILCDKNFVFGEALMPKLGPLELGIILAIVLVVFGAGRLPEIGSALGKGISAFKRGVTGESKPEEKSVEASEKTESEK